MHLLINLKPTIVRTDCLTLNIVPDPDTVSQATNSALELHKTKAFKANAEYKKDSQEEENSETRYYSMNLQKVILLPYLPNIKHPISLVDW